MSPEAQRIAIAKACGWTAHTREAKECFNPEGDHCYWSDTPDYLADLNAVHEAEKVLTMDKWNTYINHLHDVSVTSEAQPEMDWQWCTATAAQRAEALLKTLGKWEGGK